jgi:class 3 adenylate cyclase
VGRPTTRYALTEDGVHIAYQVFGEGPHDLVVHVPLISNVDAFWDFPWRSWLESFGRFARVILFDRRGMGVSDRPATVDVMAIEKGMDDLRAVLDEVGSERVALFGAEAGGAVMLMFAATYPERVTALALFAPTVYYWKTPEHPFGSTEEEADDWRERIEREWGTASFWRKNAAEMGLGEVSDEEAETWGRYMRLSASPATALALDDVERAIDVRSLLPQIQVPTLVMETSGDAERWWGGERRGQWIADRIPGARYAEIDHPHHFTMEPESYRPLQEFLAEVRERETIFDRVLATVLFTDIVDSTAQSAALGDREWRRVREQHDQIARAQIARHRGREIKTMGDGFLATFDGPARAVYCAREIVEHVRPLGIEVRSGLHTGEVELDGDDVAGLGVAIGARVGAKAGPSEVLVSQTVKDLVAGSGLTFEDAGEHELKGVPGSWHLYRVTD